MSVTKTDVVVGHYFGSNNLGTTADAFAARGCDAVRQHRLGSFIPEMFQVLAGGGRARRRPCSRQQYP
jgi:hypothetical protein